MGWQGRAAWLTILVFLWFMPQGTLAVRGASGAHAVVDDPETEMWSLVRNSLHPADVAAFLQAYPNGKYAPAARLKLQQLQRPQAPHGLREYPSSHLRPACRSHYPPCVTALVWSLCSFQPVSS
jgi:hypothetical protein